MSRKSPEVKSDLPRTDIPLDIKWWTEKLFEQLAYSEYGEFNEDSVIAKIQERYGAEEPANEGAFWRLQDRVGEVARYDEHDFIRPGEFERVIQEVTRYDEVEGSN